MSHNDVKICVPVLERGHRLSYYFDSMSKRRIKAIALPLAIV